MSYEVIAEVGEEPAKIRFYYTTTEIKNSLMLRTSYRAKNIKDAKGETQLNEVGLSTNENNIILEMLEEASYEIGTFMFKLADGVANSIFFNNTLTDALAAASSGFELLDNSEYNENLLPVIDKKIKNNLMYFCLRNWYGVLGLTNDIEANNALYEIGMQKLNDLTFQLRLPTMT